MSSQLKKSNAMRILIYGINYLPELTGIGKYTGEMAEWLAANGHEVRVVTAPPYYPAWRIGQGYAAGRYARELLNGVSVLRCPLWVPSKVTGAKRILHLASFALSSFPVLIRESLRWRPDVIVALEPSFMCTPAALLAGRLSGAPCWLHVQDLEVDAAFALGILPSASLVTGFVLKCESLLLRACQRVSTISDNMSARIAEKGVASDKLVLFPNWVDTNDISPLPDVRAVRRDLGIDERAVVAMYSGSMGTKQGLEVLLDAACTLQLDKRLLFVLCGDGPAREHLVRRSAGMSNVLWLPLQPRERLNQLLNCADIHLLPQLPGASDLVMPSKLTGMLASGRPVLAMAPPDSQLGSVLRDTGILVPPGDAASLSSALIHLAENPDLMRRLGDSSRRYAVNNLDKNAVLRRFVEDLNRLITS